MSKTNLEKTFAGVKTYSSDIWVADYTEQANKKGKDLPPAERKKLKTGVHIQGEAFDDIRAFYLHNKEGKEILAVNFEHNKGFFPSGQRDCECLLRPKYVSKGWMLLCELKYCREKNVTTNADSAYKQLVSTLNLMEGKNIFDKRRVKTFFNISMPEIDNQESFASFLVNQNEYITWCREHKVHLFGVNNMLMVNEGILQAYLPEI